jgi:hypothetical protein
MIDWPHVVYNGLWILGCAVILASFSIAHWLAHVYDVRTRRLLGGPAFQLTFYTGLGLIALGLFFLGRGWLEQGLWAALVIVCAWQSWSLWRGGAW